MKIEVLGTGCPKCKLLLENVQEAVAESGKDIEVVKVDDMEKIIEYGVMMAPGLVIDGQVVAVGKVVTVDELSGMI